MEHNKDMEDLFKRSFENFEVEPPEEIKIAIDKRLKFTDKRKFTLFGFVGIVVLLAVIISTTLLINSEEKRSKKQLSKKELRIQKNAKAQEESSQNEKLNLTKNSEKQTNLTPNNEDQSTQDTKNTLVKNNSIPSAKDTKEEQKSIHRSQRTRNNKTNKTKMPPQNDSQNIAEENPKNSVDKSSESNTQNLTSNQKEKEEENVKKDTVAQILKSTVKDSSQTAENNANPSETKKLAKKQPPLLLALKSDYLFSSHKSSDNLLSFSSRNSFNFQLEASYLLNSKIGINSGINYFTSANMYSKSTITIDSTITGSNTNYVFSDSMSYIYDSNQVLIDSVLITYISDSSVTNTYDIKKNKSTQNSRFIVSSFSLPLLFYYNQNLTSNLSLDLMVGGIISFQKMKFKDNSNPLNNDLELTKTGFKAVLKTSLRYQFTHFGVSLNNSFIYDFKPLNYAGNQSGKFTYALGIGVFWKL